MVESETSQTHCIAAKCLNSSRAELSGEEVSEVQRRWKKISREKAQPASSATVQTGAIHYCAYFSHFPQGSDHTATPTVPTAEHSQQPLSSGHLSDKMSTSRCWSRTNSASEDQSTAARIVILKSETMEDEVMCLLYNSGKWLEWNVIVGTKIPTKTFLPQIQSWKLNCVFAHDQIKTIEIEIQLQNK